MNFCHRLGSHDKSNIAMMRPGQTDLNELELAILSALSESKPSLCELIPKLRVLGREFTGVGSYTKFLCNESSLDLHRERVGLGVLIEMPGVPSGLGALLFCEDGRLQMLEIYAHGSEQWDGVYAGFNLAKSR